MIQKFWKTLSTMTGTDDTKVAWVEFTGICVISVWTKDMQPVITRGIIQLAN